MFNCRVRDWSAGWTLRLRRMLAVYYASAKCTECDLSAGWTSRLRRMLAVPLYSTPSTSSGLPRAQGEAALRFLGLSYSPSQFWRKLRTHIEQTCTSEPAASFASIPSDSQLVSDRQIESSQQESHASYYKHEFLTWHAHACLHNPALEPDN